MIVNPKNPIGLVGLLKSASVVLYGFGGTGLRIAAWLDEQGVDYVIADRDTEKLSSIIQKQVVLPEVLQSPEYANSHIIISTIIYYDEIFAKLTNFGFPAENILSYSVFMPDDIMWSDLDDNIDWELMEYRIKMCSEWISSDVKSIVDYGAGRMFMKKYISDDVHYTPVDYIRRCDETVLCDLNSGSFPDLEADVSVCSGVLEFITTAEKLLNHVCKKSRKAVIVSYLTFDKFSSIDGRRKSAYVSDLTDSGIVSLMKSNNYELSKKVPDPVKNDCTVYFFTKVVK